MVQIEKPKQTWDELRTMTWDEVFALMTSMQNFRQKQSSQVRGFVDRYVRPHLLYFCYTYGVEFRDGWFQQCLPKTEEMFRVELNEVLFDVAGSRYDFYIARWSEYKKHPAYGKHVQQLMPLIRDYRALKDILAIPINTDISSKAVWEFLDDVLLFHTNHTESEQ